MSPAFAKARVTIRQETIFTWLRLLHSYGTGDWLTTSWLSWRRWYPWIWFPLATPGQVTSRN